MTRLVLVALLAFPLHAATRTWTGAVDSRWSTPGNWDSGVPQPGDDLVFTRHEPGFTINDYPEGTTFRSILASAGPWSFAGNPFAVTDGIRAQTAVFAMPVILAASQQWSPYCCHIMTFGGGIDLRGHTLTLAMHVLDGDSGIDLAGPITGTGTIVMAAQRVRLAADLAMGEVDVIHRAGSFDLNGHSATLRSFEMHSDAILTAGARPLIVSGRIRLAGELRNAAGMVVRNDGVALVEGRFDRVPPGVVVTYDGGDGNDVVARDANAPAVSLVSSRNPARAGTAVTFTATVTPPSPGAIAFSNGGEVLATVSLDPSGVATFTTSALRAGTHAITATYEESSAVVTQVILSTRRRAVSP